MLVSFLLTDAIILLHKLSSFSAPNHVHCGNVHWPPLALNMQEDGLDKRNGGAKP